ncbi:uncharacterized protein KY384_000044 [Bacidia gigantensis]|uniref:uncharacterized protein n=1 Tax=Bacidia gigantensis TaxID=2732470 RepID=UPI001D03DB29|nr:uncharacterized protein KY384_000044 [Bacidia gigantensis]KAG8526451.1 hypothetical protein KY384_000044 [Bacidia gigantensis]
MGASLHFGQFGGIDRRLYSVIVLAFGIVYCLRRVKKRQALGQKWTDMRPGWWPFQKDIDYQQLCIVHATEKHELVADSVWEWVASSARHGKVQPVADLGQGTGQARPPQFLLDAYKDASTIHESHHYGPTNGLPQFLETLSNVYSPLYGRILDSQKEISVHSGGTEAILCAITAFVGPGDEVIVLEPAFDLYELHTKFVGGVLRSVPLHPPSNAATHVTKADDWLLDIDELERVVNPKTKIFVLNTPHNPLGKIFSVQELVSIGNLSVKYGFIIVSDEVYEHLHYTKTFARIATLDARFARNTVTVGSIGKSFNVTGWRVGYAIGDHELIKHIQAIHIILSFTTAGPAQLAAASALELAEEHGFWSSYREETRRKIKSLCEIFQELGLPYVEPSGAHYVLLNAGKIRVPGDYLFPEKVISKSRDWKLCWFLLQEFGVATIPVSGE